jgi:hypothetical protein
MFVKMHTIGLNIPFQIIRDTRSYAAVMAEPPYFPQKIALFQYMHIK